MGNCDKKYFYLPKEFRVSHDVCMGLIGEIEDFAINSKYQTIKYIAIPIEETEADKLKCYNNDILQFLFDSERKIEAEYVIKSQLIWGLLRDNCYFLQEALDCSKKMRHVVAFSMLRRPLVFNMLIILRLLTEEEFISKFITGKERVDEKEKDFDCAKVPTAETIKELLNEAHKKLLLKSFDSLNVYDLVFDKTSPLSLINMSDRALHPVTTYNKNNLTGAMNLNYAFNTDADCMDLWKYIYKRLPAILMFYVDLIDTLIFSHLKLDNSAELLKKRWAKRISITSKLHQLPQ
jgi:hypothetical protein